MVKFRAGSFAPVEVACVCVWLVLVAIDVTLLASGQAFVAHPVHALALTATCALTAYALVARALVRALRPVHARLDAMARHQSIATVEITGEIPRHSADAVRRLSELVEASDRDRDLQVASLHDAVDRARADAQTELRASMRWVFERLAERGIDP